MQRFNKIVACISLIVWMDVRRSFGVVLWELATMGSFPYSDLNDVQVLRQVVMDHTVRLTRPEVPVFNIHRLYVLCTTFKTWQLPTHIWLSFLSLPNVIVFLLFYAGFTQIREWRQYWLWNCICLLSIIVIILGIIITIIQIV